MINYEMTIYNNVDNTFTRIILDRIPLGLVADLNTCTDWSDDAVSRLLIKLENELCNRNIMPNLEFEQYNDIFVAHIDNNNNIVLGPAIITKGKFSWRRKSDNFYSITNNIDLVGENERMTMVLHIEFEDEHIYEK